MGIEKQKNPILFVNLEKAQELFAIENKINTIIISNNGDKYEGVENSEKLVPCGIILFCGCLFTAITIYFSPMS